MSINLIIFISLGSVFTILVFCLVISKYLQSNNNRNNQRTMSVNSKELKEFVSTFQSNENEMLFHNISFKNHFAENHFSAIPAIIVKGKNIFLITDVVYSKRAEQIIFTGEDTPYLIKGRNIKDLKNINYSWYEEIRGYLKTKLGNQYNIDIVCPILNNSLRIINNEGRKVCYLSEINEFLENNTDKTKISEDEKHELKNKIMNISLSQI